MKRTKKSFIISFMLLSMAGLSACSSKAPDATTEAEAKKQAEASTKQQPNHTSQTKKQQHAAQENAKQSLPAYWPQDIKLPSDTSIQTVTRKENTQTDVLHAQMTGNMRERTDQLHQQFLADGWKANIVIPQQKNTLMDYEKAERKIIIELTQTDKAQVAMNLMYQPAGSQ